MQKRYRLSFDQLVHIQVINPTFTVRKSDITKMRNIISRVNGDVHKFRIKASTYYYTALCAQKVLEEMINHEHRSL
jgi:hypothetical protein